MSIRISAAAVLIVVSATPTFARDQINIVGSSTVFPFSTTVAERFGKSTDFSTPVVESTGSGGGLKLFCSGVGERYPDITNASRRIKASEVEKCAVNGITDIIEAKIGFDGIVLANSETLINWISRCATFSWHLPRRFLTVMVESCLTHTRLGQMLITAFQP